MFEQSILSEARTNKTWSVALAFAAQVVAIGVLILIPLLYLQPLPIPELTTMLVAPPPPPPPPPPAAAQVARVVPRRFDRSRLVAPRTIPKTIAMIKDVPPPPVIGVAGGVPGGIEGGEVGGVLGGILGSLPSAAPPPPPPPVKRAEAPPPKPAPPKIVTVGGKVEAARVISAPSPMYPEIARTARVQGVVVMDAVIGKNGRIDDLKAVSGNPLLVQAAMNAVKRWTYHPTYLNGVPVQVATEIDVRFTLGG